MQDDLERQLLKLLEEPPAKAVERQRSAFDQLAGHRGRSLVLFGAGVLGRKTLAGLRSVGIEPLAFADNNDKAWGKMIDGLQVLPPGEAVSRFGPKAVFIVTIWRDLGGHPVAQVRSQLATYGGATVVISVAFLFWKYPDTFLPYFSLDLPHKTLEQREHVSKALHLWADDASRREYVAQVRWRLWLDFEGLSPRVSWPAYLPDDLFALSPDEVFVDCGAFDGDTLRDYLQKQEFRFGKIIALEPDPVNFLKLQQWRDSLPTAIEQRVTVSNSAVGDRNGRVRFAATGTDQAAVSMTGGVEVPISTLDELLRETPPTYIKMDIEGAEQEALVGASEIIRTYCPVLAICVYHRFDHLWRLPLFIRSLSDQYRFFLRPHRDAGWDLVCYAVPKSRFTNTERELSF